MEMLVTSNESRFFVIYWIKEDCIPIRKLAYTEIPVFLKYGKISSQFLMSVRPVTFNAEKWVQFHNLMWKSDQDFRNFILQLWNQAEVHNIRDYLQIQPSYCWYQLSGIAPKLCSLKNSHSYSLVKLADSFQVRMLPLMKFLLFVFQ